MSTKNPPKFRAHYTFGERAGGRAPDMFGGPAATTVITDGFLAVRELAYIYNHTSTQDAVGGNGGAGGNGATAGGAATSQLLRPRRRVYD